MTADRLSVFSKLKPNLTIGGLFFSKCPVESLKCWRMGKWSESKVKVIALSILNNHLISIDSALRSISRTLSTFQLQSAFFCFRWHCMLPSLRPLPHMPHCLCIWIPSSNTHHYIFFHFTSLPFSLWTSSLSPNILCARNTFISSLQNWKLKFWRCTLSLKCQMLHPEYQWLLFDACCQTAIVPLLPLATTHLKFDEALWGHYISSEVTPYVILVHYHFCQLSPLCKHALIFKEVSPWLSTAQKHIL